MNGTAASARGKRKAPVSPNISPPAKRAINGKLSPSDNTPDVVEILDYDGESELGDELHANAAMYIGTPSSLGEWQDTIQKVVRNVVAIRFCQTCSFDTDPALTSEATGFVVDSERGYVIPLIPPGNLALYKTLILTYVLIMTQIYPYK